MDGSSVTLDKVSIQIDASANNAGANIDKLTSTLSELKNAVKGGFNNLSKLAQSLEELKSASQGMQTVSENLKSINELTDDLKQLSEISNPKGLEKAIENLEKLPSVFASIDSSTIKNVARVSNELAEALAPLADKLADIGHGYSAVNQLANRYGVSVTKIREYTKQSTDSMKNFSHSLSSIQSGYKKLRSESDKFFKSALKHIGSFNSKLKQIGLSLLGTRTIFTATRKAVSEYMAMDEELTWQVSNNWKALGAQLAPAIEAVIYLFKQFVRVIYSIILALTGVDLIARANEKAMKGWGKSAKDTLGNLQKFDDLNVVEFPKDSGTDNSLIDLDPIDLSPIQKVIDWVIKLKEAIKEAWNSGEWFGVGEILGEGITAAFEAIPIDTMRDKLESVATDFAEFLNGVFNNINFGIIAEKLGSLHKLVLDTLYAFNTSFDWGALGKAINDFIQAYPLDALLNRTYDVLSSLIDGIDKTLKNIDFSMVSKKLSDAIQIVLKNTNKLIEQIDWSYLGETIKTVILNIDWMGIFSSIIQILESSLLGVGDFLDSLFGTTIFSQIAQDILDIIDNIILIGTTTEETLGEGSVAGNIFKTLERIIGGIGKLAKYIADTLTQWLISEEFQKVIKTIEETVDTILTIVGDIIDDFNEWFEGEGGEAIGELLNSISKIANFLLPIIKDTLSGLGKILKWLWDNILKDTLSRLIRAVSFILDILVDIIDFMLAVFAGDWKRAFEDINSIIKRTTGYLSKYFKDAFNDVMGFFERFINGIVNKLNKYIRKINKIFGGDLAKELGININISEFDMVSLPRLDTGTNDIPEDGPYYLHKHESVIPKKYNPAFGGGTNEETNRRLDTLIDVLQNREDVTNIYLGNKKLYSEQQKYNRRQNDKYGTDVNL